MTDGEKMIWAAVFALHSDLHDPPSHICRPGKEAEWKEWEKGRIVSAAETASIIVEYLREVKSDVSCGFDGFATERMYLEMIGESTKQ